MTSTRSYTVRIVKPSPEPALPKIELAPLPQPGKKKNRFVLKIFNNLLGSMIGMTAGVAIYLMLKLVGINFGGLESTLIIGFPSALGILTSLAVF
jgi:hypothetical protein